MTTDAICKECRSDWSHQVSVVATTRLQCDQTLPLSVKGVVCETMSDVEDLTLPPPPPPTHTHHHKHKHILMLMGLFKRLASFPGSCLPTIHKTVESLPGPCSAFHLFQYILEETKCSVRAELYKFFIKFNINRTILAFY